MELSEPGKQKHDVSAVSAVQAPIHAVFSRYGSYMEDVSAVSVSRAGVALIRLIRLCNGIDVSLKPSIHAGCTPDTSDTARNEEHRVKVGASGHGGY